MARRFERVSYTTLRSITRHNISNSTNSSRSGPSLSLTIINKQLTRSMCSGSERKHNDIFYFYALKQCQIYWCLQEERVLYLLSFLQKSIPGMRYRAQKISVLLYDNSIAAILLFMSKLKKYHEYRCQTRFIDIVVPTFLQDSVTIGSTDAEISHGNVLDIASFSAVSVPFCCYAFHQIWLDL